MSGSGASGSGATTWVFGYGSLVSPASLGSTLGRPVTPGVDVVEAELAGYGRRWNYGVGHVAAHWLDTAGEAHDCTIVALGIELSAHEDVNGMAVRVDADELARLDRRERDYDRLDVTDLIRTVRPVDGTVVTYVPRPAAVDRYRQARDAGTAAIEQRYWNLVDSAFAALGADRHERYRATTPAPDAPVREICRR